MISKPIACASGTGPIRVEPFGGAGWASRPRRAIAGAAPAMVVATTGTVKLARAMTAMIRALIDRESLHRWAWDSTTEAIPLEVEDNRHSGTGGRET